MEELGYFLWKNKVLYDLPCWRVCENGIEWEVGERMNITDQFRKRLIEITGSRNGIVTKGHDSLDFVPEELEETKITSITDAYIKSMEVARSGNPWMRLDR